MSWKNYLKYLLANNLKFFQFVFIDCQVEGYRSISNLTCKLHAFSSYEAFLKYKRRSETSFPTTFFVWLVKKNVYLVIFYYLIKFHYLVAFTSWDIVQYVYCNYLLTSCDVIILKLTLYFKSSRFFYMTKNTFLSFLKDIHWSKKTNFLEGENPTLKHPAWQL